MHDNWQGSIHLQLSAADNLYFVDTQMELHVLSRDWPMKGDKVRWGLEAMQNTKKGVSARSNFLFK